MPRILENKLKREYPDNPHAVFGTLNKIGAMKGSKETAKGKSMERALENKKEHKKGTHPDYGAVHGSRHNKATLHGLSPKRQDAIIGRMSLAEMHSHKGLQKFRKMSPGGRAKFAERDSEESRSGWQKKFEEEDSHIRNLK